MKNVKSFTQFINESVSPDINKMIDYTLLEESSSDQDIIDLCEKANTLGVKSVCVLPKMVKTAKEALKDSSVLVCTVISFPAGTDTLEEKIAETKQVIADGADEVDMVLNYQKLRLSCDEHGCDKNGMDDSETFEELIEEVMSLVDICHDHMNKDGEQVVLKVIVESGELTEDMTKVSTDICLNAGADFIKTSTGKTSVGAQLNKVKIMYNTIKKEGSDMMIKASGGVRSMGDIETFKPYVDRFGMGYASVDKINGLTSDNKSSY